MSLSYRFVVLDGGTANGPHSLMPISPLPSRGTVLLGRDVAGRALRISSHPEAGRVVLSIWDHDRCVGTVRLLDCDIPDLVRSLTACLVVEDEDAAATG